MKPENRGRKLEAVAMQDRKSQTDAILMAECLQDSEIILRLGMIEMTDRNCSQLRPIVPRLALTWLQQRSAVGERDECLRGEQFLDGRTIRDA